MTVLKFSVGDEVIVAKPSFDFLGHKDKLGFVTGIMTGGEELGFWVKLLDDDVERLFVGDELISAVASGRELVALHSRIGKLEGLLTRIYLESCNHLTDGAYGELHELLGFEGEWTPLNKEEAK